MTNNDQFRRRSMTQIKVLGQRNPKELSGRAVEEIPMMMSGTLSWEGKATIYKEKTKNDKINFDQVECD